MSEEEKIVIENDEPQEASEEPEKDKEVEELKDALNRVLNELDRVRKDVAEMKARQADDDDNEVEYEGTQF